MFNHFVKKLPIMNFLTSIAAFTFQITVLYPWHNNISFKIDNIDKNINLLNDIIKDK